MNEAGQRIKSFIERVEKMAEEKQVIMDDIKEIYAEATGAGFDVKVLREIVKRRKMGKDALSELESLIATYEEAIG